MTSTYEVLIAQPGEFYGHAAGNWDTSIGDSNEFATIDEAEEAIEQLANLGDDWHALYAIREIGGSSLIGRYDHRDEQAS